MHYITNVYIVNLCDICRYSTNSGLQKLLYTVLKTCTFLTEYCRYNVLQDLYCVHYTVLQTHSCITNHFMCLTLLLEKRLTIKRVDCT
jgi:hypothetical protein